MIRLKRQRLDDDGNESITATGSLPLAGHCASERLGSARSLFVRSLSPATTSDQLALFFSESYPVKHATVVFDKASKHSRGFGFVSFVDAEDASRALSDLNGAVLNGRHIVLDFAQARCREDNSDKLTKVDGHSQDAVSRPKPFRSKLIVRNLPWSIKSCSQLSQLFSPFGKILHADLPRKDPSLSPGFGFIVFRRRTSAEKALDKMNGKEIGGRKIAVDWAVDKDTWEGQRHAIDIDSVSDNGKEFVTEEQGTHEPNNNSIEDKHNTCDSSLVSDALQLESGGATVDETVKESERRRMDVPQSTLFVQNIPFNADSEELRLQFATFGCVQSALIVKDPATGLSKGTAFVTFKNPSDAGCCLREGRKMAEPSTLLPITKASILGSSAPNDEGPFTMQGRVLKVYQAVDRAEAAKLSSNSMEAHDEAREDKRRLYLLDEGRVSNREGISPNLPPAEARIREASFRQRHNLLTKDPSLHVSLSRLSIRNLPKNITSKCLKSLAREAVVGFAAQVKANLREPLSREELRRGGKSMKEEERIRRAKGKGIVKQAKVIFESPSGTKAVTENEGNRSRGYGFVEYTSHRWALMGLRWLNGHVIDLSRRALPGSPSPSMEKPKRLIVEFAIENAQVVQRRQREQRRAQQSLSGGGFAKTKGEHSHEQTTVFKPVDQLSRRKGNGKPSITSAGQSQAKDAIAESSKGGLDACRVIGRRRMARKKKLGA